ncbi:DsbA family protein [bacterium SCSIO 12741]|nr:DsbA family protein [bacterium SCSIO 12741]
MSKEELAKNPLLCDPQTGACEVPGDSAHGSVMLTDKTQDKAIKIIYFTDPICSSCWGIEPQLRKLKLEYGAYFEIEYRMGGLLPDWSYNSGGISKPSDVAHHWDEVSGYYDMPIDGDVWLEDPLPSSYPPSIAYKAAQMQDSEKAFWFMREIREMVFLQKKNITKWEHLAAAAKKVGLDSEQLRVDCENEAQNRFKEDLLLGQQMRVRGFPTLFFSNDQGQQQIVYGSKPYSAYEKALSDLQPDVEKLPYLKDWKSLFQKYPSLTAREYAELSETPRDKAEAFLNQLVEAGKLERLTIKNGSIWYLK